MSNQNPALVADMKFALLLREQQSKGIPVPSDPVSVHVVLRLLQVYRGLSDEHYAGIEICKQDTDITSSEIIESCSKLADLNIIELIDDDAFRLTSGGTAIAQLVESLRERSYVEAINTKTSIWKKDISGYLFVIAIIVFAVLHFVKD